jgi:hypothetical protein
VSDHEAVTKKFLEDEHANLTGYRNDDEEIEECAHAGFVRWNTTKNFTFYILHLNFSKFAVNCQAPYSFTPFLTLAVCPPSRRQTSLEGATGSDQVGSQAQSKLSPVRRGA